MAVIDITAKDKVRENMMDYGAYVILQRAIPDLRDGLKPVHRRILYTLHLEKATKFVKSANIEGAVMKLHPHGGTYDTMVKMAQKDRQSVLLIVGKGNFGKAVSRDLPAAAGRYTEVKLSEAGIDSLSNLNKNIVNFVPSYDGAIMVPEVLPVKFPVILTQAQSGVAYGMASSSPSFNLRELVSAMTKYINEGTRILLIPDFATRGFIVNNKDIFKKINLEGSGSVHIRGKAEIDGNNINITEVPYGTTREGIMDKVVELSKDKFKDVAEIKDLTDFKGMKVRVRFKRGTDMNVALEKLYQLTPLQSSYSSNMNVLVNGSPKVLGVWGIIDEWIKFRKETLVRGIKFDIIKMKKELHFLRGLEKVLIDIDEAIELIRRSAADLIETNLMKSFNIDMIQAKEIADMRLRNINKDYIIKKIKEINGLEEIIKDNENLIEDPERLNQLVIKGLQESADKYGVERQSKLIEVNNEKIKAVKKKIDEVPNYPIKIFVTKEGYVKKMGINSVMEDQYVKPGDEIVNTFDSWNNSELLVFGDDKCCYKIKVSEIEESTNKSLGSYIKSLCELDSPIVGYSILDNNSRFIIIAYSNNKIAKIKLDSFSGNRKKLSNCLAKNLDVIGILTFKEEGKFIFKTTKSIFKIPTSNYELKERWTQGVFGPQKGMVTEIRMA